MGYLILKNSIMLLLMLFISYWIWNIQKEWQAALLIRIIINLWTLIENNMPLKSRLANMQNICKIYKKLIIILLLLFISKFFKHKICFIIKICFIKINISCNRNLALIWIIYLVLICSLIINIDILTESLI